MRPVTIRIWQRGTPLSAADIVFDGRASASGVAFPLVFGAPQNPTVVAGSIDAKGATQYFLGQVGREPLPISVTFRIDSIGGIIDNRLIVQSAETVALGGRSVRAGSIFVVVLTGRPLAPELVFEPAANEALPLRGASAVTRGGVWLSVMTDVNSALAFSRRSPSGWRVRRIESPPLSVVAIQPPAGGEREIIASVESFLQPKRLMRFGEDGSSKVVLSGKPVFDATRYVSQQRFATSKDGTRIPYYLVRRRDAAKPVPTVITAYGGSARRSCRALPAAVPRPT